MNRRKAIGALVTGAAAVTGLSNVRASENDIKPLPGAVALLYDNTSCVGCKACVSACAEAHAVFLKEELTGAGELYQPAQKLNAKARTVLKTKQKGEDEYYIKEQCMHCVEPGCVSACMFGAMHKDSRTGVVAWDSSRCVGCRYCQVACPFCIPKFEWSSTNPRIVKCEMCRDRQADGKPPACVEACPADAIIFGKRSELLADAHKRIEESPDSYVHKVLGERDAGGTQMLMLSAIDFKELGVPDVGDRPIPEEAKKVQGTIYYGFIAPVALYGLLATVVWRNHRAEQKKSGATESVEEG